MTQSDEHFMENEPAWPTWPILFIKKRSSTGGLPETGFIFGSLDRKESEPHKCYLNCNYYMKNWEGKEPAMMTSKELVDNGWIVD